jgi:hypothetical protein
MCYEDRIDIRLIELLNVERIALVSASLKFELYKSRSGFALLCKWRYEENRTALYRKNARSLFSASCSVRD